MIQRATDPDRLNGCGLIVINPPYALEEELAAILPELSRRLASPEGGASYRLERLDSARAGTVPEPKRRMRQVTRITR